MKAKKMFEELGYKQEKHNNGIVYDNFYGKIYFRYLTKSTILTSNYNSISIGTKEHQAIHQQMVELGWIK